MKFWVNFNLPASDQYTGIHWFPNKKSREEFIYRAIKRGVNVINMKVGKK